MSYVKTVEATCSFTIKNGTVIYDITGEHGETPLQGLLAKLQNRLVRITVYELPQTKGLI
jgi:hypothetical protein